MLILRKTDFIIYAMVLILCNKFNFKYCMHACTLNNNGSNFFFKSSKGMFSLDYLYLFLYIHLNYMCLNYMFCLVV